MAKEVKYLVLISLVNAEMCVNSFDCDSVGDGECSWRMRHLSFPGKNAKFSIFSTTSKYEESFRGNASGRRITNVGRKKRADNIKRNKNGLHKKAIENWLKRTKRDQVMGRWNGWRESSG